MMSENGIALSKDGGLAINTIFQAKIKLTFQKIILDRKLKRNRPQWVVYHKSYYTGLLLLMLDVYTIGPPEFWNNLLILTSVLSLTIAYLSMSDEDF